MVITNLQNALDLAPNYAATLFSMMNIAGYTSGILAPLVGSYFTKGEQVRNIRSLFKKKSILWYIFLFEFSAYG